MGRFPLQGLSILDVGCGGGLLSEVIIMYTGTLDVSIEKS